MPDRHPDPSPSSIVPTLPRRSRDVRSLRIALLEASLVRWLRDAGWPASNAASQARNLMPTLRQWLDESPPDRWFDLLPSLSERICEPLPKPCRLNADGFRSAFARSIIATAIEDVSREARRAGHSSVFETLRPFLMAEPTSAQLAGAGEQLDLSRAALAIALTRLRHRFRERIDASLSLWAADPQTRDTLRRQLRESLIGQESIP